VLAQFVLKQILGNNNMKVIEQVLATFSRRNNAVGQLSL
jgi:hypothetical protein